MLQADRFPHKTLMLVVCLTLLGSSPVAALEGPPVNPGKPGGRQLHAPEQRQSFDFMIFGDRTGGPPEGIEVLEQVVQMANRLDVDLVLTVGDLVEGYNKPEQWLAQMHEFRATMDGLGMPWYPVPGNHDVYARPQRAGGNMQLYSEHFGPLYYSFDYQWAHFIVLFSDEALSFGNPPKNQNFSPEQMDWLRRDLTATQARQIFVFLHHPRWTARYKGCNWDDVHRMFVSDGRPVTVFAGHIHLSRSDGQTDNVRYYTLATTGGHLGRYRETAALHHVDFVRVRPDRITVAVLPVGSVLAGDFVLGHELDTMDELSRGKWLELEGGASVGLNAGERSSFAVTLSNPTDRTMRLTAEVEAAEEWALDCRSVDQKIEPGESLTMKVQSTAPALAGARPQIDVQATACYTLRSGLIQPIRTSAAVPLQVLLPDDATAARPDDNGVLVLDGSSAIRVDVPQRLERYTLECWVRGGEPTGSTALVTKTESSAFGIFWSDEPAGATLPIGYVGTTAGYLKLPAAQVWNWDQWTHVALVFDGRQAAFYVDGQPQAKRTTGAATTHNRHPLYIGADPDRRGEPSRFFSGAIDEVRLSNTARYDRPFTPRRVFRRDDSTLLLLHCDQVFGGLWPDDSGLGHHGWSRGGPKIERVGR